MGVNTSAAFTVPEGYVAILRAFKYTADPVLNLPCTDVLISILVDDIPQPNFDQMPLGSEQDVLLPTWILADNGQRIALRYDNSSAAPAFSVEVCVTFYGNLLLRTGVPIEYEQGNPTPSTPIVRGTQLRAGGGVERGRPMVGRAGGTTAARTRARRGRYRRPTRTGGTMTRAQRQRADIVARGRARR